ncbi:cell division protein FtsA [Candidatus Kryptonium thompsonii]|jgi:cell division protein FtsA|uniref:Cell division protein FtsA n=1 Tax=Candidatus Kryptonium thompsonii TaxID=1633631 RepID=A0A0N7MNP5_9BACT|nr:cell division protein FtsA [Candidatus Kryptonium thompsoni]CUS76819.1 cell division protein FtsA [Candidatus Kryptonium thompsoni]CUS78110.1 cell division protein FtsA [Candidatus Kryptonium thompsoni]CUS83681.1 cell division protein FtsA [Candidatus Kryptonium thompsoni]CUS90203.1 cell division protein FtsA [Candidatus Kryptonium thompsoni]CUS91388.1 cell division protein FtsA [Candidatus Kryptonium thompsoni]
MTYIVGLDIGTSKVCALVASLEENGNIHILGLAKSPTHGLVHGGIVNIERTAEAIRGVINMVENQSGERIKKVVVGVAGEDISGISSISVVTTRAPNHVITEGDVTRLIEDAKNIRYPSNKVILHTLPQEFKVDGVEGIKDPVGMVGIRVEATVHIVMAPVSLIENFRRTVGKARLEVEEFVFQPLASAYSVLEPEEMEIGVALIDIGAGTTDVAIFEDGIIRYSGSLQMAGEQITKDIRKAFGIQRELAEKLKVTEGYAYIDAITEDKSIIVHGIGGREPFEITRSMLCRVIQPRVEEIFENLYVNHLKNQGFTRRNIPAGIVLTGGTALLKGIVELVSEKFELPARIGIPTGFAGGLVNEVQNPIYSTVAGLVLYRAENIKKGEAVKSSNVKGLVMKLKEFFKGIFS